MANGAVVIHKASPHPFAETLGRLLEELVEHGMTIFAIIDHSGGAAQAGIAMPDTKLVIFGNPKAGTQFMLANADLALEQPLKIVVREASGKVELAYLPMSALTERYGITGLEDAGSKIDAALEAITNKVLR